MTAVLLLACQGDSGDGGKGGPTEPTGSTAETGSDPTGGRVFDDAHVLVVPDGEGVHFLRADGTDAGLRSWDELSGLDCLACTGEGASADGDGLLVSWSRSFFAGGVARVGGDGVREFGFEGFAFPHDAVRDPADDTIIVPEAGADQFRWIAGDGSSPEPVRILGEAHLDWEESVPNGIDRLDHEGRTLLVSSNRGRPSLPGRITMWDLTEPTAPILLWRFPSEPGLDVPHGPVFRRWQGRWWLLWAHSEGSPTGATVGLAVTEDPTVLPQYVADLRSDGVRFDYLRGVELTDDGWLWLTDTGSGPASGRILKARMPRDLVPNGASGAVGPGQVFVPLAAEAVRDRLYDPFEGWLWEPTFAL